MDNTRKNRYIAAGQSSKPLEYQANIAINPVTSLPYIKYKRIDAESLAAKIANTNISINNVISVINDCLSGKNTDILLTSEFRSWVNGGVLHIDTLDRSPIGLTESYSQLSGILQIVKSHNHDVLTSLNNNADILDWFVLLESDLEILGDVPPKHMKISPTKPYMSLYSYHLIDGMTCDKCGYVIRREHIAEHDAHPVCRISADVKGMRDSQWTKIDFNIAMELAAANIECKPIAKFYDMYTPEWVKSAVDIYTKDSGFAGLSLGEFVKKMKPHE